MSLSGLPSARQWMPKHRGLAGPLVDSLLVFGLSCCALLGFLLFDAEESTWHWWYLSWVLTFLVNSPHFFISYLIFYRLHFHLLFRSRQFFLVGVVLPLVLCAIFVFIGTAQKVEWLAGPLFCMFFLVGWHYVKQSFGCFIVLNGCEGIRIEGAERQLLRYALLVLWLCAFMAIFTYLDTTAQYWDYTYFRPVMPDLLLQFCEVLGYLSLAVVLLLLVSRRRRGLKDSPAAILALISAYVWLLPVFKVPGFIWFIPLFHSLQYMLFAHVLVVNAERARGKDVGVARRVTLLWWGPAFVLGALGFYVVPDYLDTQFDFVSGPFGGHFFLVVFIVFINLHHYLMDSVMWKGSNRVVRERLKPI